MFHLLSIKTEFYPRFIQTPTLSRTPYALPDESEEQYQQREAVWLRFSQEEDRFASVLSDIWWNVLRTYFGEHCLPPAELILPCLQKRNTDALEEWRDWVGTLSDERLDRGEEDELEPIFTISDEDANDFYNRLYIEIGHGLHFDLLIIHDGVEELFFRHNVPPNNDDIGLPEVFLRPLLTACIQNLINVNDIDMSLTYSDETGVHCDSLSTVLTSLGFLK